MRLKDAALRGWQETEKSLRDNANHARTPWRMTSPARVSCSILGVGCYMARRKETTIERIYREVTGRKMSQAIKRILLPKRNAKPKTA